jgi:type IV pilus assembly protein PilQ
MYNPRLGNHDLWLTPGGTAGSTTVNPIAGGYTPVLGSTGISGQGFGVNFPVAQSAISAAGGVASLGLMFGTLGGNILDLQLNALQSENKLNILSSPSITTLDNQKAFTENGARVPYSTLDTSVTPPTRTVKFEDAMLRLEITPHVIDGKNLMMKILVKKDEVDMTRNVEGNPFIIKKQTETSLIVQDGETIVISGLTKQQGSNSDSGIPGLKDIPALGWLFKGESKSESMEEVLIFITPKILPPTVAAVKPAAEGRSGPAAPPASPSAAKGLPGQQLLTRPSTP